MAAQSGDILYSERSGIPGKLTAQQVADLAFTVMTQAAYDALTTPQKEASGLVLIVG